MVYRGALTKVSDAERDSARVLEGHPWRYGIRHPVINDKDRQLWDLFEVEPGPRWC